MDYQKIKRLHFLRLIYTIFTKKWCIYSILSRDAQLLMTEIA